MEKDKRMKSFQSKPLILADSNVSEVLHLFMVALLCPVIVLCSSETG